MALINEINGGLIQRLSAAAGSSSQASSANSSIGGRGVAATFDGATVDVRSGLQLGAEAFTRSLIRLSDAVGTFQVVKSKLSEIYTTARELSALAQSSLNPETTDQERTALNSNFRAGIAKLGEVFSSAEIADSDFLEVSELERILKEAGVNADAASKLGQYFARIGGKDGSLGFEKVRLDDETLVSPLTQRIDTVAAAANALTAFKSFTAAIKEDLDGLNNVLTELNSAANFAAAGSVAFGQLYESVLNSQEADAVAVEIVAKIRNRLSDNQIGPHSDLDTLLSAELLG